MQIEKLIIAAALLAPTIAASAQDAVPAQNATPAQSVAPVAAPETSTDAAPVAAPARPSDKPGDDAGDDGKETVIVVTAARNPRRLSDATSAVTVITRAQIEQKKPFDITDVLRMAPSLSLVQSGGRGQIATVFLRGASSSQTLVLVDGVRFNSPSNGLVDFGTLGVENIERIEVLRGPQSALYGSDALGGVINIITRRGGGEFRTGGSFEFGNYSTNRQEISARGSVGKGALSFGATRLRSSGQAINSDFRDLGASLRYDRALSSRLNLALLGRADDAQVGVPGQNFGAFNPLARSQPRNLTGSIQLTNTAGKRRDQIVIGMLDRRLQFNDPLAKPAIISDTHDRLQTLDAQTAFNLGRQTVTLGGELRRQKASDPNLMGFNRSSTTRALFVQDEIRAGKLSLVPGVRYESSSQFGHDTNGRISGAYNFNARSKFKASLGSGFRAPSFVDLYFPGYSNPNLQPEKSASYDFGYERVLPRGGRLEVMRFHSRFRSLIAFNPATNAPSNIDRATTQGYEISLDQPFANGLRAIVNLATLSTSSNGAPLVRRPKFTATTDLLYRRGKLNFDLGFVAQGRRNDFDAMFNTTGFGGFSRFDFSIGYDVRPGVQLYTRAQNLFNRRYEAVSGYPAPRFNLVFGLQSAAF